MTLVTRSAYLLFGQILQGLVLVVALHEVNSRGQGFGPIVDLSASYIAGAEDRVDFVGGDHLLIVGRDVCRPHRDVEVAEHKGELPHFFLIIHLTIYFNLDIFQMKAVYLQFLNEPIRSIQDKNIIKEVLAIQKHDGSAQEHFLLQLTYLMVLKNCLHQGKQKLPIPIDDLKKVIDKRSGSFINFLLKEKFTRFALMHNLDKEYQAAQLVMKLTRWVTYFEGETANMKRNKKFHLASVLQDLKLNPLLEGLQEAIIYLSYISTDITSVLIKKSSKKRSQNYHHKNPIELDFNLQFFEAGDILSFLNAMIPKAYFNILIERKDSTKTTNTSTTTNQKQQKPTYTDQLYCNQQIRQIVHEKSEYQYLIRNLFILLLRLPLDQTQHKDLLMLSFRYYYLFSEYKGLNPMSIVASCMARISPAVRFAVTDELLLFFQTIRKLDQHKFIEFLMERMPWVRDLMAKLNNNSIIGSPLSSLNPFNSLGLGQRFYVESGKTTQRFVDVIENNTYLCYSIKCQNHDINLSLYFLGSFESKVEKKKLIFEKEKLTGTLKGCYQAGEAGIYMFEFDNTFSWIKGKNIEYDTTMLTPFDLDSEIEEWKSVIYDDEIYEEIGNKSEEAIVSKEQVDQGQSTEQSTSRTNQSYQQRGQSQRSGPSKQAVVHAPPVPQVQPPREVNPEPKEQHIIKVKKVKPEKPVQYVGQGELSRYVKDDLTIYDIKVAKVEGPVYEYETESTNLVLKKINQFDHEKEPIKWFIRGKQTDLEFSSGQKLIKWMTTQEKEASETLQKNKQSKISSVEEIIDKEEQSEKQKMPNQRSRSEIRNPKQSKEKAAGRSSQKTPSSEIRQAPKGKGLSQSKQKQKILKEEIPQSNVDSKGKPAQNGQKEESLEIGDYENIDETFVGLKESSQRQGRKNKKLKQKPVEDVPKVEEEKPKKTKRKSRE